MSDALLSLSPQQTGDVAVGDVAGTSVTKVQGMDPAPVVDLLGARIERQLERVSGALTWLVAAVALLVLSQLFTFLLWGPTIYHLIRPYVVAGGR